MTDLDSDLPAAAPAASNAPPFSVSELAGALKRTLEDRFGFVRLRGEISKVTRHASGHVYLTLKDERAAIDGVIWKGLVRGLAAQPEQGLEVIVTGKITTFPASSKYQIVIEAMEAAGAGALLAQLERLKARLAGEGLFAPERKKSLPASPAVIGVITSPTGAVIRDILHRIRDRWPCRVIVWPVIVQGDQAAAQVRAAIEGFAALQPGGVLPRPDLLIVARGGGSIEDLWAFNDEALARAVAACPLPVISAVGHETDTTLIDFVSDRRAPTPTAAAEMATPVLSDLKALLSDLDGRRLRALGRSLDEKAGRLRAAERGLPNLPDLFALSEQRFDLAAARLSQGLERHVAAHERRAAGAFSRLSPQTLPRLIDAKAERLTALDGRLRLAGRNRLERARQAARLPDIALRLDAALKRRADAAQDKLDQTGALLRSLDPKRPLRQGFALVRRDSGAVAHSAAQLKPGETVTLTFAEDQIHAVIGGTTPSAPSPVKKSRPGAGDARQADLF